MIVLQCILVLAVFQIQLVTLQSSDIPSKLLTLKRDTSFVTLSPIPWSLTDDGDQLIVPIRFRTRASKGRLITLTGIGASGPLFTLSAYVQSSTIIIDIANDQGVSIKRTERQLPEANNGKEHSMSVHFNPVLKQLKVVFGQGTVDAYDQIEGIPTEPKIDLTLTAGKYGEHKGIVGCITLVALSVGKRFAFDLPEQERSEDVVDGCESLCDTFHCSNQGQCIDLFEAAVCDCREIHKSGVHCDEDLKSVNVSWDQYIAYEFSEKESQPHIISLDFKTMVKEGVLLHGSILSANNDQPMGDLKLALIYGQLRLTIGDFVEINFYNVSLSSETFHEIVLLFDYVMSEVRLSLDGETKTKIWYEPGKEIEIRFGKELFFSAGGSEVGLSGCLRRIYVGYVDVIDAYFRGNSSKVIASHALQRCDHDETNGALLHAGGSDVHLLSPVHNDGLLEGNENPTEGLWAYEKKQKIISEEDDGEEVLDADAESITHKIEDEINAAVETNKIIDEPIIDHKFVVDVPIKKQLCENSESTFCKNHIECIKKGNTPICVCKKGFTGKYCQFSTLPWNCDDVLISGDTGAGIYVIDVDGSGPLLETYVFCRNGQTIIPHNMPNRTLMRSKDLGDIRLRINYKLFSEDQLRHLREFSEKCKQTMRYDCNNAPLGFSWRKTWFTSLYGHEFTRLMDNDGSCQCVNGHCGRCNCDNGGENFDAGTMESVNAPITNIYALNDPTDQQGHVTLSPLICTGSAGRSPSYTATVRNRTNSLALGDWNGKSLSFEFRAYEKELTIISSKNAEVEVQLLDRSLYLLLDTFNITLTPQFRLNNGEWHRVVIEVIDNTIRLSVQQSAEYLSIERPLSFDKVALFVGGGEYGFLGCIRQVIINNGQLLNIESLSLNDRNIELGCEDRCQTHMCQHQSKCEQDFENDSVRCVCHNNIIHSGPLCENSINQGSEVSLHNLKRGFLKIQKLSSSDAIKQRIVLSVRTDRRDALFIYMHDHLYNFVQIHLSDHNRIILTTNYNRTVRRCEIVAKSGQEFSRMQWLQIILFQNDDRMQMSVDDEVCEILDGRFLSDDFITKFEIDPDMEDVVEPPVTPLKRKDDNQPFTLLFIGGVPTENYKGKLDPTYKTTVPTLLGCIRGAMVGDEVINLRDHTFWPYFPQEPDFIRIGCETGCEAIEPTCKNDGHCTFKWTNTDPSAVLATCDCTRTSYYGEFCEKDSGAHFDGNSMLEFNAGRVLEQAIYDWSKIGEQTFDFAFAAKSDSVRPQQLAAIHFNNDRKLEVILCKNGSINVAIQSPESIYVHTFPFNYSDGYRHFFQSTFGGKTPLTIAVDSSKFNFPRGLSLANAIKYDFGGLIENEETAAAAAAADNQIITTDSNYKKHNYSGCIANIDINLNVGRMHFKPIIYLADRNADFAQHALVFGDQLALGACSSFKIPGTLPALQHTVNEPEWDSPLQLERFYRPTIAVPTTTTQPPKGTFPWWIIVLIIILLLILLIILLLLCCRKKKKDEAKEEIPLHERPNDMANNNNVPELTPLISPTGVVIERPTNLLNNYDIPEATQPLDRPFFNSPVQPKGGIQ